MAHRSKRQIKNYHNLLLLAALTLSVPAYAGGDCSEMETWDFSMGMCMPLPMEGMAMRMLMVHGNLFGAAIVEEGPRGRQAFAAPNMIMADAGMSLGSYHYLNLDFMGTLEKWTLPRAGYPELLQIGERDADGKAYLDAQHPHSSPIMGLTLSDTLAWGHGSDHVKISFAPRGQSSDGPIAFMHRPTGMVNPDAPLGHHIGQDVGHVSSTVLGAALKLGGTELELSIFHGEEPEPAKVDLPVGKPDSFAVRLSREFSPEWLAMASMAYVNAPEPDDPDIAFITRYSASIYHQRNIGHWRFHNALIYGLVTRYDHAEKLSSFVEEFLWKGERPRIWGRLEFLQRTPAELGGAFAAKPDVGLWVTALTAGYTQRLGTFDGAELGLGASLTKNLLPGEYRSAYGGDPWSAKVFLQFGGTKMWEL